MTERESETRIEDLTCPSCGSSFDGRAVYREREDTTELLLDPFGLSQLSRPPRWALCCESGHFWVLKRLSYRRHPVPRASGVDLEALDAAPAEKLDGVYVELDYYAGDWWAGELGGREDATL